MFNYIKKKYVVDQKFNSFEILTFAQSWHIERLMWIEFYNHVILTDCFSQDENYPIIISKV